MSVNWKVCNECGKKINEVAKNCPYCDSTSFKKYEIIESDIDLKNSESKEKNVNKNESFEKIKGEIDKFSDNAKKVGNDFIYENLPEEYAEKLSKDMADFSKTAQQKTNEFLNENEQVINIKKGLNEFSDSTKKIGVSFINDNLSQESQEKIKEGAINFSQSTKKFVGDATTVFSNVHSHRKNKRDEKKAQKRKEKEEKKRKKEAERKRKQEQREKEWEENRIKREKREKEQHEQTLKTLRETKSTEIRLPVNNPHSKDVLSGAIEGQMMGAGLGMAIDGLKGSDSLSHTANSGLIWGGAGAVLGGLAAASDDGIRWVSELLHIGESELIIAGKFVIPYDQIKLISLAKYKFRDIIVITLPSQGIEFSHSDVDALKTVIDESIEEYHKKLR